MQEFFPVLRTVPLFAGMEEAELASLLACLNALKRTYEKGERILRAGEPVRNVGIVLDGRVQVYREEFSGARTLLAQLAAGNLFAEAFACANVKILPVSVEAVTDCKVLFIDYKRIVTTCPSNCAFHARLIRNMMGVLADKNILLSRKIQHISKRSTREKLLSFLHEQAGLHRNAQFLIPFNRQELADYLCVDRSAMSAELSRLQQEGVLSFHRSAFKLHVQEDGQ